MDRHNEYKGSPENGEEDEDIVLPPVLAKRVPEIEGDG